MKRFGCCVCHDCPDTEDDERILQHAPPSVPQSPSGSSGRGEQVCRAPDTEPNVFLHTQTTFRPPVGLVMTPGYVLLATWVDDLACARASIQLVIVVVWKLAVHALASASPTRARTAFVLTHLSPPFYSVVEKHGAEMKPRQLWDQSRHSNCEAPKRHLVVPRAGSSRVT